MSNYITREEFKNLTKVDISDFALKTNVAELKNRVDHIDANKINIIDKLQGKNFVQSSYLYFNQKYEYFEVDKTNPHKLLSWKSIGVGNENFRPLKNKNAPRLLFEKTLPYLKIESFKFLAQKKITYRHENIVNLYIVYSVPDITDANGTDLMRYGLFGATAYDTDKKLVGYGVGFGTHKYTHDHGKEARDLVITGVNSPDPNNALVLGMGNIKITASDKTVVQAKDKSKMNCTTPDKKFVLSVHYNADDDTSESFFFVNSLQQHKFKASKDENLARKLNLGSFSDNSVLHYSHTLNGNICHFSLDYQPQQQQTKYKKFINI